MEDKHVAIYVRISQDDGEKEDVLSDHRRQLLRLAEQRHFTYDIYEEVVSGEKLSNRVEMQHLLKKINRYNAVLVMDLDRLSRDDYEASQIKQLLYMNDVLIITPLKEYDLDNDADETLFSFQSLIAKMELKQIRKRFKRGKLEGARQGRWTNGVPPLGYRINKETKRLEIVEEEATVIRKMKNLALKGYPAGAIAEELNRIGCSTRSGHVFSGSLVHSMLMRRTYQGYVTLKSCDKRGRLQEEIVSPLVHEPLITETEYIRIRKFFNDRRSYETKSKSACKSILQGLLFCKCGKKLSFGAHHDKRNTYVKVRECHNSCQCSGIKAELIEAAVLQVIKKVKPEIQRFLERDLLFELEMESDQMAREMKMITKKIDKYNYMGSKLLNLHLQGKLEESEYLIEREKLGREISVWKEELAFLEKKQSYMNDPMLSQCRVKGLMEVLNHLEDLDRKDLNILLKTFIKKIRYWRVIPENVSFKGIPLKDRYEEMLRQFPPLIEIEFYDDMDSN